MGVRLCGLLLLALLHADSPGVQGAKLRGGDGTCGTSGPASEYGGGIVSIVAFFRKSVYQVIHDCTHISELQVLSDRPRIIYYPDFLSEAEIADILAKGGPMLKPSRTDAGLKQDIRSSVATFFTPEDEMSVPAIRALKQRAFAVTKMPYENQEELQMQRYREPRDANSQKDFYVPHYDSQPEHERKRVCTMIIYLEEPEEGGETIFPMVHVNSTIRNKHLFSHTTTQEMAMNMWRDGMCEKAARGDSDVLAVKPKRGSAVLFYTLMPDGKLDSHSVHCSCPVSLSRTRACVLSLPLFIALACWLARSSVLSFTCSCACACARAFTPHPHEHTLPQHAHPHNSHHAHKIIS